MNIAADLTMDVVNARRLRCAPQRLAAGIAVLAMAWPVLALADCVDTRKPTAGEKLAATSEREKPGQLSLASWDHALVAIAY